MTLYQTVNRALIGIESGADTREEAARMLLGAMAELALDMAQELGIDKLCEIGRQHGLAFIGRAGGIGKVVFDDEGRRSQEQEEA